MNALRRFSCAAAIALPFAFPAAAPAASAKVPLDYRAYDGWNRIAGTVLSDDGRYAAYVLMPQDGDPTLIVHDFETGKDLREPRGLDPAFTADARYVVYGVRAPNPDIHRAQRQHKKPDESPKNGLGILDLAAGTTVTVERVKTFKLAKDPGNDTLAYALEPALSAPGSPAATASPSPSPAIATPAGVPSALVAPTAPAGPSAAPSASPSSGPDDLHKKEDGTVLVVRDLASAVQTSVKGVTGYAVSHDGAFVAYAVSSKDGKLDAVRVRRSRDGATLEALAAPGHYKNLTFAPKKNLLAFVSDAAEFASPAPRYALYQSDLTAEPATGAAQLLVDATAAGFAGMPPSENGTLRYTKDGARLFFGVAPAPTPVPAMTPDPMKVDIWNWQDRDLQSTQRHNADDERKRTFAAIAFTNGSLPLRLARDDQRIVVDNENASTVLALDDLHYRKLRSWDADYDDVYSVSLAGGARRLLMPKQDGDVFLSPDGAFAVAYDATKRSWFSVGTLNGKRTDLTAHLKPAFYDELDDHPAPPPPYGLEGWLDGGRYVLLRDRYDVWAVDPQNGSASMLTRGEGRRRHLIFEPQQLDPDADSFDSKQPIVLKATDDETKDQGIFRVTSGGPSGATLQQLTMLPKALAIVAKARAAGRVAVSEQTFSEVRNLWSAPGIDAPLARLSDANPQRANYLWGDEQLVSYRSAWGVPLRGVLYTPDNLDRHRKYPMLVYFYERFSTYYHAMPFTVPGPYTSPDLVRYVSNGYVVLVPDVAYRTGHPGDSAYGCILPAIDAILRRGFVDPSRVGIAGHSWAAYQIAYLLTRTNRFRAAEAGAAVANMTSAYGGIRLESGAVRESQYETGQSRIGATPWDRTELYIENSALFHIRSVNTPYLTIANELDGAVPQSQGIEFFTALRRLGKEAYLFSFDGEDHNLVGREQQKYWTVHLDEFFDHFLLGKPEPDWMAHGVDFLHRGERDVDKEFYGENF